MDSNTRDRINAAIANGNAAREEARQITETRGAADPEVAIKLAQADGFYNEARTLKTLAKADDDAREFEAWQNAPANEALALSRQARPGSPTMSPEYRSAFDSAARKGFRNLTDVERSALNTGSDTAGGFLVPEDVDGGMAVRIAAASPIFSLVTKRPTSRDRVAKRRVRRNTTSGHGSIYTSDFVGSWVGEIPAAADGNAEPKFGKQYINVDKYRALCKVSRDEADDTEFDLFAFLREDGSRNAALGIDYAVLVGSGVGDEPLGVMNLPSVTSAPTEEQLLAVDIEGSTANTISNTTSDLGTAPKMITLFYSLPAQYRNLSSCRWLWNSSTEAELRKLVDANGNFMWTPGFVGAPDTFLGKQVTVSEWMPDDGTDANKPILFGALEFVKCPIRRGISTQIAEERYIDTDEIGFFLSHRMGVGVENYDAFRLGQV